MSTKAKAKATPKTKTKTKAKTARGAGTLVHDIELRGQFAERLGGVRAFRFKPGVNVLCGSNGSGKTTILDALVYRAREPKRTGDVRARIEAGALIRCDFEKDNPRTKSWAEAAIMGDIGLAQQAYTAREMSHGQVTRRMLEGLASPNAKASLVMLDEPEQALDLDGLAALRHALMRSAASQIIVATHAPLLILEPSFHVVEMTPGYRDRVAAEVQRLARALD